MTGQVSYLEIGTGNVAVSRSFFEQLFGWTFHAMEPGNEGWFQTPSIRAGVHGNDPSPQFAVYFDVPNLEKAVSKVKELGGKAEDLGPEEPGFGRFCNCTDPQGVRFGLHQPSES